MSTNVSASATSLETAPVRVAVFGAGGRMGTEVCRAVSSDPALSLAGAIDPGHEGVDIGSAIGSERLLIAASAEQSAPADVAVDFTTHDAAMGNLRWCAANGVHAVVGTTGFSQADLDELRTSFTTSNCLIAPNFAIGAVLMMRFSELAAPYFETVEVLEFHHDQKIDAPSGTAMATVARIAAAKGEWAPDPTQKELYDGARGGLGPAGIRVHAIRMRGAVANQEVLFGTTGQTLSIRHDTTDRTSFMPGVLLAIKRISTHPGLTLGLDAYLDR